MFTKRSTNLYCIAIICLYTETIESRETPLLRRRKQNSPFCLAELFHFSPFLFLQKEEKPPGLPLGRFFLSAVLPYQNENVYKTFNSILLYRHNLPVYSNHQIKRDPTLGRCKQNSPFCLAELFHFSPFLFTKAKKPSEPSRTAFSRGFAAGAANHTHIKGMRRRGREAAPAPQEKK